MAFKFTYDSLRIKFHMYERKTSHLLFSPNSDGGISILQIICVQNPSPEVFFFLTCSTFNQSTNSSMSLPTFPWFFHFFFISTLTPHFIINVCIHKPFPGWFSLCLFLSYLWMTSGWLKYNVQFAFLKNNLNAFLWTQIQSLLANDSFLSIHNHLFLIPQESFHLKK